MDLFLSEVRDIGTTISEGDLAALIPGYRDATKVPVIAGTFAHTGV
ncbi:hypothetical protein L1S32_00160 [Methanogenium sp. S4BF]|nr:hypothetical protein [Methanogenium sp. S4BF]WFN34570.1 hypothetical protein L1S32_00160 [Methanogenium sp. S4BF]